MLRTLGFSGTLGTGTLLALALTACASPKVASRARERQRAALERSLEIAQLKLAKAQTEMELGELRYHDQLAHAEKEFELAKRRQQIFTKFTAPNRLAQAELSLQQLEDSVGEVRAELQQLEQVQQAATEPARRRLQRAERDLELRRDEFQTLKEVTLPLEQSELDLVAEEKKRAVLQVQRDNEGALLDRRVALLSAEAEVTRLEDELADSHETTGKAERKPVATQPAALTTSPE